MGLAAGQARLLSITSRKADCEFQSMRLSHQKIALSRELADLSNEYQNSLDQTKLVYDYYGTGDTSTPLTYGLLMSPSTLNDYMPITVTDSSGRVTLNSKYAAAARAAGIPQEGLGTLPSESMRNAFIAGLASAGVITEKLANSIASLPYNQGAGLGGGTTVGVVTETGTLNDLADMLNENGSGFTLDTSSMTMSVKNAEKKSQTIQVDLYTSDNSSNNQFTLGDLLTGDTQYTLGYKSAEGELSPVWGVAMMQNYLAQPGGFLDWMYEEFSKVLDTGDGVTGKALEYAYNETYKLIINPTNASPAKVPDGVNPQDWEYEDWRNAWLNTSEIGENGKNLDESTEYNWNKGGDNSYVSETGNYLHPVGVVVNGRTDDDIDVKNELVNPSEDFVGFIYRAGNKQSGKDGDNNSGAAINLNNIAKAFLTYFADYMNGVSKTDENGLDKYYVNVGACDNNQYNSPVVNRFVTNDMLFQYTFNCGNVASDDLGQAQFYDALFNQICANGWTENNQIDDKEYLQQMLQSGMLFISKVSDDGYYYQGNYATDSYIKEVADETAIAQAEAKYNTEKAKLNAKEETLDLKMKNLDTEISSLTTEYDTVKNTISKNIEKSFKRYNA